MNSKAKGLTQELLLATQILASEGVIDGFGHVSVRNPDRIGNYFMLHDNCGLNIEDGQVIELDRESNPINPDGPRPSIERFIHGEIYRLRPDVGAVVHTHAPPFIPFGVSTTPLQPLYHMCGFMNGGVPVFDIAKEHGMTNMLITEHKFGRSLASALDQSALVLMRGHGATVVGASIKEAVFRAVYATVNAQLQFVAIQLGNPKYLTDEEAVKADELHQLVFDRPWDYWMKKSTKNRRSKVCQSKNQP
jgi:HCOMODA/2-hydroxy-3-carboxy-muconic semialdehyde decarboxylase